jgi:hypothetical protein
MCDDDDRRDLEPLRNSMEKRDHSNFPEAIIGNRRISRAAIVEVLAHSEAEDKTSVNPTNEDMPSRVHCNG